MNQALTNSSTSQCWMICLKISFFIFNFSTLAECIAAEHPAQGAVSVAAFRLGSHQFRDILVFTGVISAETICKCSSRPGSHRLSENPGRRPKTHGCHHSSFIFGRCPNGDGNPPLFGQPSEVEASFVVCGFIILPLSGGSIFFCPEEVSRLIPTTW
ncbi:hypothetical protein VTI28DRAFT_2520 [Corynascus sepedonium]